MIALACLCGQVRIDIARRPGFVHECNCTLCSKSGARWAYLDPSEIVVSGTTEGYTREDKADASADVRFCPRCGTTTHFRLTPAAAARFGDTMVGVNMRLADERDVAGIELRFPDGRGWPGTGEFGYVRAPILLGSEKSGAPG